MNLSELGWPLARVGEALEALARRGGLEPRPGAGSSRPPSEPAIGDETLAVWIEALARQLDIAADPHAVPYPETARFLRDAGPALFRLPGQGTPTFLALLQCRRRTAHALGPDLAVHRLLTSKLAAALGHGLEARPSEPVDALIGEVRLPSRRQARARAALVPQYGGSADMGACWLLRLAPGAGLRRRVREARLAPRLLSFIGSYAVHDLLWILSWWVVGRATLEGRMDPGWLTAWVLLLLTSVPFRLLATWSQGLLAIGAGGLLKQQLLYGALKLEPDEVRHQGVGQHLALVMESEAVEWLALSGGLLSLVAGVQLIMAGAILAMVASVHLILLVLVVMCTLLVGVRYFACRRDWTDARLRMTHDLVEGMVGHRTRLAQGARSSWHEAEDQMLESYVGHSGRLDRVSAMLLSLIPRGWLVLGLFALAPSFLSGRESPGILAVALGSLLLGSTALGRLTSGLSYLTGAAIAWRQVAPLMRAARRPEMPGRLDLALARSPTPLIVARDLSFRYSNRAEAVLRSCSLDIGPGDRILLVGPSGSGKSTLVSLLTGLRVPDSGLLLLGGLDLPTLGTDGWRRRVAAAPQFHENHVLTETLAFNLLMGARWPPQPKDLKEAEAVCCGLGLGDLLSRMPARLFQTVGETGWRLSHGERSRLYIARALLQGADLVILDESFGQLDPESLRECLRYVSDRAPTLLVIAHS